jgi:hypothetical protein
MPNKNAGIFLLIDLLRDKTTINSASRPLIVSILRGESNYCSKSRRIQRDFALILSMRPHEVDDQAQDQQEKTKPPKQESPSARLLLLQSNVEGVADSPSD